MLSSVMHSMLNDSVDVSFLCVRLSSEKSSKAVDQTWSLDPGAALSQYAMDSPTHVTVLKFSQARTHHIAVTN